MSTIDIKFSAADLAKISRYQQRIPHITEDTRLKAGVGQLLAAQGKININQQSPDGKSTYKALNPKYEKYKGFDLILIGRKKNTTTKKGKTNNRGVQSGVLRKSLDWSMGAKDVIYLTSIDYGKYLQEDRPFFSVRDDNKIQIMTLIKRAFKRLSDSI